MKIDGAAPAVRVLLVILGYLAVVIWLTWPLGASSLTHLPCTGVACAVDTLYSTWVLAWESHALGTSPFHLLEGNIYHPARDAVLYGPAALGALPYFAPIYAISGSAVFALNATLVLCIALTAAGLHLVILRWTGRHSAGAVAAAVLLTSRWLLWGFVGTAPHLAALQCFPLIVLLAVEPRPGAAWVLALLALVVMQCLTDAVYVAPALLAPLGLLALGRLCRRTSRADGIRLALVVVAAAVILLPLYLAYLQLRESNPDLAMQSLWHGKERALRLEGLFWKGNRSTTVVPAALVLVLVGGALALGRHFPRRSRKPASPAELPSARSWRHGALWLLAGAMLSLPPRVVWGGTPSSFHRPCSMTGRPCMT
jgi:hypothetical protein